ISWACDILHMSFSYLSIKLRHSVFPFFVDNYALLNFSTPATLTIYGNMPEPYVDTETIKDWEQKAHAFSSDDPCLGNVIFKSLQLMVIVTRGGVKAKNLRYLLASLSRERELAIELDEQQRAFYIKQETDPLRNLVLGMTQSLGVMIQTLMKNASASEIVEVPIEGEPDDDHKSTFSNLSTRATCSGAQSNVLNPGIKAEEELPSNEDAHSIVDLMPEWYGDSGPASRQPTPMLVGTGRRGAITKRRLTENIGKLTAKKITIAQSSNCSVGSTDLPSTSQSPLKPNDSAKRQIHRLEPRIPASNIQAAES
ncbi:hypothetical protein PMAYCL1PPCAC_26340, partial [Pristionchus mayeri]